MAGFGFGNYLSPQVGSFIDQRRNALAGLGAGLLGGQPGAGVQQGLAADSAYAIQQKEHAERERLIAEQQNERNQTTAWIQANFPQYSNLPPAQAWQAAMGDLQAKRTASSGDNLTTDQRNWQYAQANPGFADFLNENGGGVEYGLTPIWGQLPDGSFAYGVQGKDGTFRPVDTGDINPLDPRSLNIEKGAGTTIGKGQGEAVTAAPTQLSNAGMALGLIEEIRNHPELPWATGRAAAFGMNDPRLNPQRAAFQDLVEQSKGGAFLQAIQQMQGMGALSNAEGATATAAINRINTAVEKKDFLKALEDYETIVKKGMEKAKMILASQGLNEMGLPAGAGGSDIDSILGGYGL